VSLLLLLPEDVFEKRKNRKRTPREASKQCDNGGFLLLVTACCRAVVLLFFVCGVSQREYSRTRMMLLFVQNKIIYNTTFSTKWNDLSQRTVSFTRHSTAMYYCSWLAKAETAFLFFWLLSGG